MRWQSRLLQASIARRMVRRVLGECEMSSNDWGARLVREAKGFMGEERKGSGAIARYVAKTVTPYIGVLVSEGAAVWRPDSDEAVKQVTARLLEDANVASIAGLKPEAAQDVRNVQGFIRRAVKLYRACCILADRHETGVDWSKPEPLFPVAWFVPEGRIRVIKSKSAHFLPMTGKEAQVMRLETDDDEDETHKFTVSEKAIISLAFPAAARGTPEESGEAAELTTLSGAVDATLSMLAKADYAISGEASQAFVAMLEAFMDASPSNLALIAGLVEARASKRDAESVAA
jgi:hypothetical protein